MADLDARVVLGKGRSILMEPSPTLLVNFNNENVRIGQGTFKGEYTPLLPAALTENAKLSPNVVGGASLQSSGSGNLFNSSWENGGTGCGSPLLDGGAWNDYGGPGICTEGPSGGPAALITTSEHFDGARSCQIIQMPGNINGTDFRVIRYLSSRVTTTSYYRFYHKWESSYVWSPGNDHKMLITGPTIGGVDNQHIYINIRGNSGGTTGYVAIHLIVPDSVVRGTNVTVQRGVWTRFELAVTWGSSGAVQARVDGVQLTLAQEAGNAVNPANFVNSAGADFFKMDSTYNNGGAISGPMSQYWDSVAVGNQDWIGA